MSDAPACGVGTLRSLEKKRVRARGVLRSLPRQLKVDVVAVAVDLHVPGLPERFNDSAESPRARRGGFIGTHYVALDLRVFDPRVQEFFHDELRCRFSPVRFPGHRWLRF